MTLVQGFEDVSSDELMDVDGGWDWGNFFSAVVNTVSSVVNTVVSVAVTQAILGAITVAFPPMAIITGPMIAAVGILETLSYASAAIGLVKSVATNLVGGSSVTNSSTTSTASYGY